MFLLSALASMGMVVSYLELGCQRYHDTGFVAYKIPGEYQNEVC